MKQYAVIGHPIAHSLSPFMHNTAFKLLGLDCRYEAFDIEADALTSAMSNFREKNFGGLNVTIPHKQAIFDLVDEAEESARTIGAVNTVSFTNGKAKGYNTDVDGVIQSLEPYKEAIKHRAVLVLGAGGAARAVLYAVLNYFAPKKLTIASRTVQRAEELAGRFGALSSASVIPIPISHGSFTNILKDSSLVINATPVGMSPNVNNCPLPEQAPIHSGQVYMDLIYSPLETQFLKRAKSAGARTISGLEMFIHQGARAFEIWTGKTMPVEEVRRTVLEKLQERG